MAALAPPPYRPSPSPLSSTAPSSSSSTSASGTPSKKQENSAAVAAGRRRLEEFKRKKALEKGKKTSPAAAASDRAAHNVAVLPASGDPFSSPSRPVVSNGHASQDTLKDGINVVSTEGSGGGSSPPEVAMASLIHGEHTSATPSVSEGHWSTGDGLRKDPLVTAVSSGGVGYVESSTGGVPSRAMEQTVVDLSGTPSRKADAEAVSSVPTPPWGASGPLFVPPPPQAGQEILGHVTGATGYGREEPLKHSFAVRPSRFRKSSSETQGSFNPSSQKVNGGNLVMLDSKLVPSNGVGEGQVLPKSSEPEQEPTSLGKSRFPSAWMPPSEKARIGNQTGANMMVCMSDGMNSTPASSGFSYSIKAPSLNTKSGNEKDFIHAAPNSSTSTLPPSLGITASVQVSESSPLPYPSFSEASAPKYFPLPPPLYRPPIPTSTSKSEPFLPPVSNEVSASGSSPSTVYSTVPSTTNFFDNALLRPSAPLTFQFPAPMSAINAPHENGKREVSDDSFRAVLPRPSSAVGEFPTQPIRREESSDQRQQPWPSSGGDDFAMLEQHIEDLTQEKFSLQRGLDAARALAETLAQENSALGEDYNNQGALVNDLKAENERQQGEIRAQAVVVKNMKAERDKAMQESSAAVERSQALAAEVIALEEKVLRARSQELKLQREMESLGAEMESQKRQMLSLDKDRANLKTLMEALQEEKGLLQVQIRKATAVGSSGDTRHSNYPSSAAGSRVFAKSDASTSTDDFEWGTFVTLGQGSTSVPPSALQNSLAQTSLMGFQPLEQQHRLPLIVPSLPSRPLLSPGHSTQVSGSFVVPNEGGPAGPSLSRARSTLSGRGLNLGPISAVIPPDQGATIGNINALITELAEEKEALVKALRAESVGAAQLRTLNSELSHKLEVQTQRLELSVAQSMAHSNTPRLESTYPVSRVAPEYLDEGDEVVDRVLGWIMQLFPSGSSRRKRL